MTPHGRRTRILGFGLGVMLLGALTACDQQASAPVVDPGSGTAADAAGASATAPAPTSVEPVATADGSVEGLELEVVSLARTAPNVVTLRYALDYQGEEPWEVGETLAEFSADGRVASGAYLVDQAGRKKYLVLRDANGECLCSELEFWLNPGGRQTGFAQFPAPPEQVSSMSVYMPTFPPVDGVPLAES